MPAASTQTIKGSELWALIQQQGFNCAYSGRKLTPETASADHIVPLSREGEHNVSNIAIVHMEVNAAKGAMTLEEFVQMCRDVVAWQDAKVNS